MSTSLLYHAFGIRGYRYVRTEYREGGIVFAIIQDLETCRCAACGSRDVQPKGQITREFHAVPIGRKSVTIAFGIPRVLCLECGVTRQVQIAFADPRRTYTRVRSR